MSDTEAARSEFTIRTSNPEALDQTLAQLPMCGACVVEGSWDGDTCQVRVLGDVDFFRFAVTQQGYGEIVDVPHE